MKKILIFDTSISSENVGDCIIMDAVNKEILELFNNSVILRTATHECISKTSYALNKVSNYSFVGGTNLLSSNMNVYNQWKINLIDAHYLKRIILIGVGWWQYQGRPNFYTKYIYNKVLSKDFLHSVRDSYTKRKLGEIGIENVINTGCITTWGLTKDHCLRIPSNKSKNVVFTLTDYNKNIEADKILINTLVNAYDKVYFWPQGIGDLDYMCNFGVANKIEIIGGNLNSYDDLLDQNSLELDYVGTRLHAGIRALQKKRRSIIISIDNRAQEMSADLNFKVLMRNDISSLAKELSKSYNTEINLNVSAIKSWKAQFFDN